MLIEDVLETLGCVIVGPVSKLEAAVQIAKGEQFDAAILDITIRGGQVFPVAEVLMERHIPFIFASGYGDWSLPENFRGRPRLVKALLVRRTRRGSSRPASTDLTKNRQLAGVARELGAIVSGVIQSCSMKSRNSHRLRPRFEP